MFQVFKVIILVVMIRGEIPMEAAEITFGVGMIRLKTGIITEMVGIMIRTRRGLARTIGMAIQ